MSAKYCTNSNIYIYIHTTISSESSVEMYRSVIYDLVPICWHNNGIGFSRTFSFNKFIYFRQTEIWMSLLFVWMDFHFRVSNCEREFCQYFSSGRLGSGYAYSVRMSSIVHSICSWFLMVGEKKKYWKINKILVGCVSCVVEEMESIRKMAFVCGG